MSDEKQKGPGQESTPGDAAERRAAHVAALKEERRGYEARGLAERAAQVDEQIAHFEGSPKGRKVRGSDKA